MRRNRFARALLFLPFAALAAFLFGYVTMRLWNWLLPGLFGLHTIGYWQAIGLMFLGRLLFGGFHGRHGGHGRDGHWRERMREKWEHMTPEEREKFRHSARGRWGSFDPPEATTKA
jgi:hypothetical protein